MKTFLLSIFTCYLLGAFAQQPRLVVPIGHTEGIYWVSFSQDGKIVRTSSPDGKTIQWNLEGKELEYDSGDISSVSQSPYSPDGKSILKIVGDTVKLLDFSGRELQVFYTEHAKWFGFSPNGKIVFTGNPEGLIKQWDLTGRLLNTCKLPDNQVAFMEFSPDGKSVLTANGSKTAALWDMSGRLLQTFTGHADQVINAAFTPDGKSLLVGGFQGCKRWDLTDRGYQNMVEYPANISAVAFSPDGQYVMSGSKDGRFKFADLTGKLQQVFKGGDSLNNHAVIAFSPPGRHILTNGDNYTQKLWELSSAKPPQILAGHKNEVSSATFSPDGKTILTSDIDETVIHWDLSGKLLKQFEKLGSVVAFSPDAKTIIAGNADGIPTLFDLSGRVLRDLGPAIESCAMGCFLESIVSSPDGKYVLTTNGFNADARLWSMSGGQIRTFDNLDYNGDGHKEPVFEAFFSPDGKKVVTCSKDYSVKIWDTTTGQCLATLIALDSTDWVVTSPSGLFDASPGAMNLMYFVVGEELDVIELEQLKERYYEPGLLSKVMGFSNEPLLEAVAFDSVALYPSVRLQLDTAKNKLRILLTPRNGGVGKVSVFINDKEIIEDANPLPRGQGRRDTAITVELAKYARYFLLDSLNTVSIRAYNQAGWLKSAAQKVEYRPVFAKSKGQNNAQGAVDELLPKKRNPSLHLLVVGSSDYAGAELDLQYAAKDARDMAAALEQIGKQLFVPAGGQVTVHLLTTDDPTPPTKTAIKVAFDTINAQSKAEDVVVVYFSGHGITYGDADRALFYYLTRDIGSFDLSDAGIREKRAISSRELTQWLTGIPARKQVLILDACNSGKMVEDLAAGKKALNASQIRALDRLKDRTGMFVLAGSAADKVSFEAGQYGQGLLTFRLLQGMNGMALQDGKTVDVMTLFQDACNEVPVLAQGIGGIQKPMLVGPVKGSFPIGIKNEQVKIPIADPKPVFIRNVFMDELTFDDALGLTDALETHFREMTVKGAQADLIFVDVKDYPEAYAIKGLYKVTGEAVEVRCRLFKGKTAVGNEFKIAGKKSDVPGLAGVILEGALKLVQE